MIPPLSSFFPPILMPIEVHPTPTTLETTLSLLVTEGLIIAWTIDEYGDLSVLLASKQAEYPVLERLRPFREDTK